MVFKGRKRSRGIFRTHRFSMRLRRNTESALSQGNRVFLFPNGGDFFPVLLQAFRSAVGRICAEFYIIKDDETGNAFADALIEARRRGVDVLLIYDYIGCIDTPSTYFNRLEAAGVRCLPFNKPAFSKLYWLDVRDHRKLVVVDDKTAFLGSLNVGDEYAGYGDSLNRWRDVGISVQGPAVAELLKLFLHTWETEGGDLSLLDQEGPLPAEDSGDAEVMIISGSPHHIRPRIHSAFRMAMAGASESIRIITPYFIPGPRVVRSLLRAALRGVKVQIILPSISDVPIVKKASRAYLTPLLKAGAEVYEREGTVLHAKVMLIDNCWVTLGSANLDYRSLFRNFELNVIVDGREFGAQVDRMFTGDLAKSRRITIQEHEKRSWFERLLERLCNPIGRFL